MMEVTQPLLCLLLPATLLLQSLLPLLLPATLLLLVLCDSVQQAGGLMRIEVGPERVAAPQQSVHEPIHGSGSSRI